MGIVFHYKYAMFVVAHNHPRTIRNDLSVKDISFIVPSIVATKQGRVKGKV